MNIFKLIAATVGITLAMSVAADDGELLRKSISRTPGQPDTMPISEAEHAFIDVMPFYVASEAADGELLGIEYFNLDGTLVDTRTAAKPLIGVYINGPVEKVDGVGFVGHGRRDAFAAVSTDDGSTWKRTNLSDSADVSSSSVVRADIDIFNTLSGSYPGDVVNIFQATAANRALVAWPSRYCQTGSPIYSLETSDPESLAAIAAYMGIDLATASPDDIYLLDLFGVAGQQGEVDYAEDKFEQNQPVGEVPYSCLWVARGTLELDQTTGTTEVVWRKAERLTSGRRDVNRVEVRMVKNVGAVITWQEDPDGLRGGQGEGPGEGWSGAIANHKTDVWYSYIDWGHVDLVQGEADATQILTYEEYLASGATTKPKAAIPFAMPMRLTDNNKCNIINPQPYCIGSAIEATFPDELHPLDYGLRDMCAATISATTSPQGSSEEVCVTEDGMPLLGNVQATRPRTGLYGYDSDGDGIDESGWVVVVAEESKGQGKFFFTVDGTPCIEGEDGCEEADYGKDIRYLTFSMALTDAQAGQEDSLIQSIGVPGHLLNQPETDWRTGVFYPTLDTADMWGFGETYDFTIYRTEIARRGSLLAQGHNSVGSSRLVALPAWKQGVMRQGGPADVMVRRIVKPAVFNEATDNPYAFANMVCSNWIFTSEANPYYPGGLCLDPPINLSATVPDTCTDSQAIGEVVCPTVDASGIGDTNPILQGNTVDPNTTKVLTWHQCPSGSDPAICDGTSRNNLLDQSWYNPLDVAKGHRGYLDGNFVMLLYAWSPNWRLNAKGSDRYELYVRRSFNGAQTWTTLPGSFTASDGLTYNGAGTTACETHRSTESGSGGGLDEPHVCYTYPAGADEQARNVSQHKSMKFTTLDPRYAKPKASIVTDTTAPYPGEVDTATMTWDAENTRDPSRYFMVFESGDNSTVELGEAEPLNLHYSRAVMFGDHYQVWAETSDLAECYPSDPHEDLDVPESLIGSGFCNEFDELEGKKLISASEASLESNPAGQFMYGAWSQIEHDKDTGLEIESNSMVRRVWYIDEWVSEDLSWDIKTERIFMTGFEDN